MYCRIAVAIAAFGFVVAGCAPVNPQQTSSAQDDAVYSTGSHLPKRSGGGASSTVTTTGAPSAGDRSNVCVGGPACGGGGK
jgi:hypothetical protein